MKILVVDDEPLARARLRRLLREIGVGEVVGEAGDGRGALDAVHQTGADLVLLDVRMPGMDGLEVARHLARLTTPPAVVFTTADDRHALAAFEANAIDYLVKPVRLERLTAALERACTPTRAQLAGAAGEAPESRVRSHISATMNGALKLVPVAQVRFFRAEHKYVTARYPDGEIVLDDPLASLENEFGGCFLRVHRNALISTVHVRALEKDDAGRMCALFDGVDERVEVSRRLTARVRRALRAAASGTP